MQSSWISAKSGKPGHNRDIGANSGTVPTKPGHLVTMQRGVHLHPLTPWIHHCNELLHTVLGNLEKILASCVAISERYIMQFIT